MDPIKFVEACYKVSKIEYWDDGEVWRIRLPDGAHWKTVEMYKRPEGVSEVDYLAQQLARELPEKMRLFTEGAEGNIVPVQEGEPVEEPSVPENLMDLLVEKLKELGFAG